MCDLLYATGSDYVCIYVRTYVRTFERVKDSIVEGIGVKALVAPARDVWDAIGVKAL